MCFSRIRHAHCLFLVFRTILSDHKGVHRYRLLASISNVTELYKEQLRVGENILAFLASVAMSLIQASDRASGGLDVRDVWDGGASPGHWRDITGKCCKVLSTYKDHPLASSIVGLHITAEKRGFGAAVQKLITAKNNFKHDRGPRTEEELESATKDMQQTLDTCIKALAFFTEHPIRQVVDHDGLPDDQLQHWLYGNLGVVSLQETIRPTTTAKKRVDNLLFKWDTVPP